jgi:hypothetical protein
MKINKNIKIDKIEAFCLFIKLFIFLKKQNKLESALIYYCPIFGLLYLNYINSEHFGLNLIYF